MGKISPIFVMMAVAATSIYSSAFASSVPDWWEHGHFYQVYPRSFQDSDGDGIGDISGITQRLPYLKEIGVTGIWLSPIFLSPMLDFGYDISDFRAIDPQFGSMADFKRLVARSKELDIKIILDFVPNHTSDEHEWFQIAINKTHPEHLKYKDFFIWHEGKLLANGTRVPPSNWLSIFRGSAWQWVEGVEAYFLHQFLSEQPDLNFRNQQVVEEMKEILRFWLREGVDGFRVDAIPHLVESDKNEAGFYDDEPLSGECLDDPLASCYLKHTETKDLQETFDQVYLWRKVMEEPEFANQTRIIMTEAYSDTLELLMKYYGRPGANGQIEEQGAQIPFNFNLIHTNYKTPAWEFERLIREFVNHLPQGDKVHANWVLGNHDKQRIASRFGPNQVDIFNILSKTLPGITVTYYGEEIGMADVYIPWELTVDPQACRTNPQDFHVHSRDKVRTPFQWDNSKNAGFSSGAKTWLPVDMNYTHSNVFQQNKEERSHLKVFRQLINLRQNPTMKYGAFQIKAVDSRLLVYKRQIHGQHDADIFVVLLNLDVHNKNINLYHHLNDLPPKFEVVVSSIHSKSLVNGTIVETHNVRVPPEVGVVLVGKY